MELINLELDKFDKLLLKAISVISPEISKNIKNFIFAKSKRIRPSLIFLTAKALNIDVSEDILKLSCAVEIIHNATLIHDDIIDNAQKRRGKLSLNRQIGNNLSVLSGDILLSIAMKELTELNNIEILEVFSLALQKMCTGEINQNSSLNKLPSIDEYIIKSQNKTAELFCASLEALCILKNIKEREKINNFALNFGTAFQIKDDLNNILKTDKTKPELSDIYNGIYTLPIILFSQRNKNFEKLTKDEIINQVLKNPEIIEKTTDVIKKYTNRAIASLDFMKDNQYKEEIIKLTNNLIG